MIERRCLTLASFSQPDLSSSNTKRRVSLNAFKDVRYTARRQQFKHDLEQRREAHQPTGPPSPLATVSGSAGHAPGQRQTLQRPDHGRLEGPSPPYPAILEDPGSNERAVSTYIIRAIMTADTWERLETLVASHATSFNYIHTSALVCRLPKLARPSELPSRERARFNRFLSTVSDMVSLNLHNFDARAIANVLWGVSKLGYSPAPPLLNKFLFEAYVRMHDFNAQELANIAWALATLAAMGNQPVPMWMRKFTCAAVSQVPRMKPSEVAHLTWALSKLCPPLASPRPTPRPNVPASTSSPLHSGSTAATSNAGPTSPGPGAAPPPSSGGPPDALPALLVALVSHAAARLRNYSCGEAVMTVMSLHQLDPAAGAHVLSLALPHLLRACPNALSPQDLSNLWFVLDKCAVAETTWQKTLERSASMPRAPAGGGGMGAPVNVPGSIPVAAALSPANSACSSSGSGGHGGQAACASSVATAVAHPPAAKPPGPNHVNAGGRPPHSSTLAAGPGRGPATSRLAAMPLSSMGRHHLYALFDLTERSLHDFTAQGLCTALAAWTSLRLKPSEALMAAVYQRFQLVLPAQATFQCVSVSLWAMARLELRPDPKVLDLLLACARLQMATAKPCELVALVWALQKFKYRPSRRFLPRLNARLVALATRFRPHGLHILITTYTLLGERLPAIIYDCALAVTALAATVVEVRAAAAAAATSAAVAKAKGEGSTAPSSTIASAAALTLVARAAAKAAEPFAAMSAAQAMARGAGAKAAAPIPSTPPSAEALTALPPCVAVRFLAALVGVGVRRPGNKQRRGIAQHVLWRLRWRLGRNRSRRRALVATLEATLLGRLGGLSADALCALLTSMVRLRLVPSAAFMREVHVQAVARVKDLKAWHVGGLVAAMGALHSHPPPGWLEFVLARMADKFELLSNRQLLGVLRGVGRLRYRPSVKWMQLYLKEWMARVEYLRSPELGVMLRTLGILGLRMRGGMCEELGKVVQKKWKQKIRMAKVAKSRGEKEKMRLALKSNLMYHYCRVCSEGLECKV